MPVPLGVRMRSTCIEPQRIVTLQGTVRACWSCVPSSLVTRGDEEPGLDDSPEDGSGYLHGVLNTQTSRSVVNLGGDKCLKPGPLASTGLLLHGHNLQNLEGHTWKKSVISDSVKGKEKKEISSRDFTSYPWPGSSVWWQGPTSCPLPCLHGALSVAPAHDPLLCVLSEKKRRILQIRCFLLLYLKSEPKLSIHQQHRLGSSCFLLCLGSLNWWAEQRRKCHLCIVSFWFLWMSLFISD